MEQRTRSTTTTEMWAETITARIQAVADQLGVKGYKLTNINSATAGRLQSLSGIGVLYARKIVEGRPYQRTDELVTKHVVPQYIYDRMKDQIVARQP